MDIQEYYDRCIAFERAKHEKASTRKDIALFGVIGEIGSLTSAVKKQLSKTENLEDFNTKEIEEEIGDIIWYSFLYVSIYYEDKKHRLLGKSLSNIAKELTDGSNRSMKFASHFSEEKLTEFLSAVEDFSHQKSINFDEYQRIAFLTARTDKKVLLDVCLIVLTQLGAELMRRKLPSSERELNDCLVDRHKFNVIGEIAWHLAAIASVMGCSLSSIAKSNLEKVSMRFDHETITPLHDEQLAKKGNSNVFPRRFSIVFVTIGHRRSRMYWNNKPLGDDLTDNYDDDDGYRFHDVLHLANIAYLGWSPVIRALMQLKRKSNNPEDSTDEVQDGARARIVEEAIIKTMHMEGVRILKRDGEYDRNKIIPLFTNKDDISFSFLKLVREFAAGLEVEKNKYWEWEAAIIKGFEVYHQLRINNQGTVHVNLEERKISYTKNVHLDIVGSVNGMGTAHIDFENFSINEDEYLLSEITLSKKLDEEKRGSYFARIRCVKMAVLEALDLSLTNENLKSVEVTFDRNDRVSIRTVGDLQNIAWSKKIISFRVSLNACERSARSTVLAITDPKDII